MKKIKSQSLRRLKINKRWGLNKVGGGGGGGGVRKNPKINKRPPPSIKHPRVFVNNSIYKTDIEIKAMKRKFLNSYKRMLYLLV